MIQTRPLLLVTINKYDVGAEAKSWRELMKGGEGGEAVNTRAYLVLNRNHWETELDEGSRRDGEDHHLGPSD